MNTYTVSMSCTFDAATPEDATLQMVEWLDDFNAWEAGYRVIGTDGTSTFIDADTIDMGLDNW